MKETASQPRRYVNLFRHVANPWFYLGHKLGLVQRDPLVFRLSGGLRLRVPASRLTEFKCIVMDDCYFRGFRPDVWASASNPTMLDIGANLGFFAVYALSRCPSATLWAVEPLKVNHDWMSGNFALNPGRPLHALHLALGAARGTLTLAVASDEPFPTDASVAPSADGSARFDVPAVSLGELLAEQGIERVDLLKMDCEGAEYAIFYAADAGVLAKVQRIAMEVHGGEGDDHNIDAMHRYLCGRGFHCLLSDDRHFIWAARHADDLLL